MYKDSKKKSNVNTFYFFLQDLQFAAFLKSSEASLMSDFVTYLLTIKVKETHKKLKANTVLECLGVTSVKTPIRKKTDKYMAEKNQNIKDIIKVILKNFFIR